MILTQMAALKRWHATNAKGKARKSCEEFARLVGSATKTVEYAARQFGDKGP